MIKKTLRLCLLLLIAAAPLAAFDYGGRIGDTAEYRGTTGGSLSLYDSASAHMWVSALFPVPGKLRVAADCSYEFRYDQADGSLKHILDLNLLKVSYSVPAGTAGTLGASAGRFAVSDATGIVFNQVCDGAYAKLSLQGLELTGYGGTTAVLNAQNVAVLTPADSSWNPDFRSVYVLCPAYIPAGLSLAFPSLFANQTLSAECWVFADASPEKYTRAYGTLALSGPLYSSVFYTLSTTAGTEKWETLSNLSKASVSFYPVPQAVVGVSGTYASGRNGFLSAFRGFTSYTSASPYAEPEYSGLVKAEVTGSYTVIPGVCVTGRGSVFFACPGETVSYDGWQWNVSAVWNIFSDVQVSAGAYQFYAPQSDRNRTVLSASAVCVF